MDNGKESPDTMAASVGYQTLQQECSQPKALIPVLDSNCNLS
jgi:hypothetical protein